MSETFDPEADWQAHDRAMAVMLRGTPLNDDDIATLKSVHSMRDQLSPELLAFLEKNVEGQDN